MVFTQISVLQRLKIVKITICAGLICGILISTNLWISQRTYPLTPILPIFYIPPPFDQIVYFLCITSLILSALLKNFSKTLILSSAIGFIFFLTDQSRLQPWAYQYFFMLALLANLGIGDQIQKIQPTYSALQFIIIAIYFWSGLSKLNPQFFSTVYPWLINLPFINDSSQKILASFGLIVPVTEIMIALMLILKKSRIYGIIFAASMHLFILLAIGPLGHNANQAIWPWNLAMIVFVVTLFWGNSTLYIKRSHPTTIVTIFFLILPFLSYFNLWGSALSFELYSGNVNRSSISLSQSTAEKLPPNLKKYLYTKDTKQVLNTDSWSTDELNVPVYREKRIYRNIVRTLCNYATDNHDITLNYQQRQKINFIYQTEKFSCKDV